MGMQQIISEPDLATAILARNGDREAFARLVADCHGMFYRVAWRYTGRRADAEDVAQEACVRLGRAIRGWRGDGSLTAWLYRIAVSTACDHLRKRRRERDIASAYAAEMAVEAQPSADGDAAERLWEAVRSLPEKTGQAIVLVHAEGLSHAQAAEALECAESTVSWHVHEAKKRLRAMLAPARGA